MLLLPETGVALELALVIPVPILTAYELKAARWWRNQPVQETPVALVLVMAAGIILTPDTALLLSPAEILLQQVEPAVQVLAVPQKHAPIKF